MSNNYYANGAIHNDNHKEVTINGDVTESALSKILSFMADDTEPAKKEKRPKKRPQKAAPPRELMTFGTKNIIEAHLDLLYLKLTREEMIDGNSVDFKLLFSNRREETKLVWTGKYGTGTLVHLFKELIGKGFVTIADNFTIPHILEGHFVNTKGAFLSRLEKGDKPNGKALPIIQECLNAMNIDPKNITDDISSDYEGTYDPYDHQDIILRKH